jgi:hypothetical protein
MRTLLICLSLVICAHLVLATVTTSSPLRIECPSITVDASSELVCPDGKASFTASMVEGDSNIKPTYNWTLSSGKIIKGQGTPKITVATTDEHGHSSDDNGIRATVEVGGLGGSCASAASAAIRITPFCPERKLDEYGDLPFAEEKVRLENLINRLQSDTETFGLIVVHAAEHQPAGEAEARAERARNYVANERGIDRVMIKDGGSRDALTVELWVMPTMRPRSIDSPAANSTETPVNSNASGRSTP